MIIMTEPKKQPNFFLVEDDDESKDLPDTTISKWRKEKYGGLD